MRRLRERSSRSLRSSKSLFEPASPPPSDLVVVQRLVDIVAHDVNTTFVCFGQTSDVATALEHDGNLLKIIRDFCAFFPLPFAQLQFIHLDKEKETNSL